MQLGFNDYLRRRGSYQSLPKYLDSWQQAFFGQLWQNQTRLKYFDTL